MNPTFAIIALVLAVLIPTIVYVTSSSSDFKEVERNTDVKPTVRKTKPAAKKTANAKKPAAKKPVSANKVKEAVKQYKATGKTKDDKGKPVELAVVNNRLTLVKSAPVPGSVEDLRSQAKAKGITGYSSMNKTQLLEAINGTKPAEKPVQKNQESTKEIPAAKPAVKKSPAAKAEEKIEIIDQVVAEIMKPAEPKAAETPTPTTTQPEEKKE